MGLVKTRRLAAMRKQTTYAKATVVKQRAILLRQGYGGLKAGMKPPVPKQTRKGAPFSQQASKPSHTKFLSPNL